MPFGNSSLFVSLDGCGFWLEDGVTSELFPGCEETGSPLFSLGAAWELDAGVALLDLLAPGLPCPLYMTQLVMPRINKGINKDNNFFFIITTSLFLKHRDGPFHTTDIATGIIWCATHRFYIAKALAWIHLIFTSAKANVDVNL